MGDRFGDLYADFWDALNRNELDRFDLTDNPSPIPPKEKARDSGRTNKFSVKH